VGGWVGAFYLRYECVDLLKISTRVVHFDRRYVFFDSCLARQSCFLFII
jgi:hypothetical protein